MIICIYCVALSLLTIHFFLYFFLHTRDCAVNASECYKMRLSFLYVCVGIKILLHTSIYLYNIMILIYYIYAH